MNFWTYQIYLYLSCIYFRYWLNGSIKSYLPLIIWYLTYILGYGYWTPIHQSFHSSLFIFWWRQIFSEYFNLQINHEVRIEPMKIDRIVVGFTTVPIATKVVSSYFKSCSWRGVLDKHVIKLVSDLWQVGGFLRVLWFLPPIKLTAIICKCNWNIVESGIEHHTPNEIYHIIIHVIIYFTL